MISESLMRSLSDQELLALAASTMRSDSRVETLPLLHEIIQRDSKNGRAHYLLAVEQASLGLISEARSSFSVAIDLCPDLIEAKLQYIMLLVVTDDTTEARVQWNRLANAAPSGTLGECSLVLGSLVKGEYSTAVALAARLEASNELERPLVQALKKFVEHQSGHNIEPNTEDEHVYIGGYAKLDSSH